MYEEMYKLYTALSKIKPTDEHSFSGNIKRKLCYISRLKNDRP